jgi:hypothetical protein
LTLALTASVSGSPIHHGAANQRDAAPSKQQPASNAQPSTSIPLQNAINRLASALEATNSRQPSTDEDRRAKEDLEAQKQMAYWAKAIFWPAIADTVLTLLGVFLIWRTLKASWAAARAAEKALAAQDRPHVMLSEFPLNPILEGPEPEKSAIKYAWNFQNYGEDLAFLKGYGFAFVWLPANDPLPDNITIPRADVHWPVPPGQGWGTKLATSTDSGLPLNEAQRASILAGTLVLYLASFVTYKDTSGEPHETRSVHVYRLADKVFVPFNDERHWKYT